MAGKFNEQTLREDFSIGLYVLHLQGDSEREESLISKEELVALVPPACTPRLRTVHQVSSNQFLFDFVWDLTKDQSLMSTIWYLGGKEVDKGNAKFRVRVEMAQDFDEDFIEEMMSVLMEGGDSQTTWSNPAFLKHPSSTPSKHPAQPVDPQTEQLMSLIENMDAEKVAQIRSKLNERLGDQAPDPSHIHPHDDLERTLYANNQALIRNLVKEGVVRRDLPKLDHFFGTTVGGQGSKLTFAQYKRQVLTCAENYDAKQVKEAMYKSCKGQAAEILDTCPATATWQHMLEKLRVKYSVVAAFDVLMGQLHAKTQGPEETVAEWSASLEVFMASILKAYPEEFSPGQYDRRLKDRFYRGLHHDLKLVLRPQHKNKQLTYEELVEAAREVEVELDTSASQAESQSKASTGAGAKTKVKVSGSSVTTDQAYLSNLEALMKSNQEGLAKTQAQIQSLTALFANWQSTSGHSARGASVQGPVASDRATSEQSHNHGSHFHNQGHHASQPNSHGQNNTRGRGGRWGPRGRGGRGGGRTPLCHFCKYSRPDDCSHWQSDCQHFSSARAGYWQGRGPEQQGTTPEQLSTHATASKDHNQGNWRGGH